MHEFENIEGMGKPDDASMKKMVEDMLGGKDTEFTFVPLDGGAEFRTSYAFNMVRIIPLFDKGVIRADANTGVVIPPGREAELWALASFYTQFRFKICELVSRPDEYDRESDDFSWSAGERIHFIWDCPISSVDPDNLVRVPAGTVKKIKGELMDVAAGRKSPFKALRARSSEVGDLEDIIRRMRDLDCE